MLKNNASVASYDKNTLSLINLVIWKEGVMWEYLILKTDLKIIIKINNLKYIDYENTLKNYWYYYRTDPYLCCNCHVGFQ
ncbi:hypothetical protein EMIT036CA2_10607 [Chryseobacterium sp. IT-36CA2]